MSRETSSADELLDTIHDLVNRLVHDITEEDQHERANLGNEIVLCASVLWSRLGRAERALKEKSPEPGAQPGEPTPDRKDEG